MDKTTLDNLRALEQKATPGPWLVEKTPAKTRLYHNIPMYHDGSRVHPSRLTEGIYNRPDGDFIAAAAIDEQDPILREALESNLASVRNREQELCKELGLGVSHRRGESNQLPASASPKAT